MKIYGIYKSEIYEPARFWLEVRGFTGKLATDILGEQWVDNYLDYRYDKGDEHFSGLTVILDENFMDADGRLDGE